ncbi:hypothetical protein CISIN_1g0483511mg, partial [Citrus sinensis]
SIPDAPGPMISLRTLTLSDNELDGEIPKFFQNMFKLEGLSLRGNSLEGVISEHFFSNFSYLKMGPHFPKWLQTQKHFSVLDISSAGISDSIPDWFSDTSHKLADLNFSHNQMTGRFPNYISSMFILESPGIDISSNHLEGPSPSLPSNAFYIDLSKNKFSGPISFLCSFSGQNLVYLDLSSNLLSGKLPDCWLQFNMLRILNLANNNFSGKIPNSCGYLQKMLTLSLHHNNFSGELPSLLKNFTHLRVVALEENSISGNIPAWIGESLLNLVVLDLRSNRFYGKIPFQLCHLADIQILDLSLNNISGNIPKCFNNFTAMTQERSYNSSAITFSYAVPSRTTMLPVHIFFDIVLLTWKGSEYEYKNTLGLVKSVDLSSNKLGGEVPEEIMDLVGLIGLNLSRNNLTGYITPKIGQLQSLDFLDLSRNQFSGGIPSSLSQVNRLSVMDLSHNNLSGKIPTGTQLQSFNASVYDGNPELCGLPLPSKCWDEESAPGPAITKGRDDADTSEDEDQFITLGFFVTLILGFIVGFWGVCGTLLLNNSWKHCFYNFLTVTKDWLYVTAVVNIGKIQQKMRS